MCAFYVIFLVGWLVGRQCVGPCGTQTASGGFGCGFLSLLSIIQWFVYVCFATEYMTLCPHDLQRTNFESFKFCSIIGPPANIVWEQPEHDSYCVECKFPGF